MKIEVSEEAVEFLTGLAESHCMYGDTMKQVVDDLLREWEIRDRTPREWRVFK